VKQPALGLHGTAPRAAGPGSGSRGLRLAFYSHDSYGLGHFRRCLLLARHIREQLAGVEVLIVTGSPRAFFYSTPAHCEIVTIAPVTKNAKGEYVSRNLGSTLEETIRLRKKQIREAVHHFRPDIFVVDHAPSGLRGELLPLLADLKFAGHTELVLGMRDVIDDPNRVRETWKRDGTYRLLDEVYDQIWVYGCKEVFEVDKIYGMSKRVQEKLIYLGYLRRVRAQGTPSPVAGAFPSPDRPHLVCVVGGGGDGYPLAKSFLRMLAEREDLWNGTLVTGPFLSREKRNRLLERFGQNKNVQLLRFTSHLEELLSEADLVVTMGGYNAVMEAVCTGKPVVIVPRVFPRKEQWLRAQAFQGLRLVSSLDPDRLDVDSLAESVRSGFNNPLPPDPDSCGLRLDGIENFLAGVEAFRRRIRTAGEDQYNVRSFKKRS